MAPGMHICVSLLFCARHTPRAVSEAQHLAVRCGLDEAEIFFQDKLLIMHFPSKAMVMEAGISFQCSLGN